MSEPGRTKSLISMGANAGVELLVNVALPFVIYVRAAPRLGEMNALLVSSAPPILWSLTQFVRTRRIDALSLMVLAGIVLSLLAFLGGGSVRFLQLRENLVGGLFALVFLGSAAIGRPLIYEIARASMMRRSGSEAEAFAALRDRPLFRRSMTIMTIVWGAGLLAQTILACVMVFTMPVATYLLVGPFVGYAGLGALALWTFWFAKRQRRRRLQSEAGAVEPVR